MNASGKLSDRRRQWSSLLVVVAALFALACGGSQGPAKGTEPGQKFVFAPPVGLVFRHEMKQLDEFSIPGSAFRESEEWRVLWEVKVEDGGDKYLYRRRLVEFAIKLNGEQILAGSEVTPRRAEIVQVMGKDGKVLDITGTEQLTETLASLVPPDDRASVKAQFSPAVLRATLTARAEDAFDEVVGKPADVGQTWSAQGSFGPFKGKTVRVDSALGCRGGSCRKLVRTFEVDEQMIDELVKKRVAGFLAERGWDPAAVRVVESNLKVEDQFVVEPASCLFHDAQLTDQGSVVLEGPNKGRLELVVSSKHSSHSEYPPPG